MENKTLAYVGLGVILLLLVGTFAIGTMGKMGGNAVSDTNDMSDHYGGGQPVVSNVQNDMSDHHGGSEQSISLSSEELAKYRSENIPTDCRLPDYDNDVNSWKERLSHHKETQYCLEYYK